MDSLNINNVDKYQMEGSVLASVATMMLIEGWRNNDVDMGRKASIIMSTLEVLNCNEKETEGIMFGMVCADYNPTVVDEETKKSHIAFMEKCANIAKAVKHSMHAPEHFHPDMDKEDLVNYLKDKMDKGDAPSEDGDTD